jgi:hypothetical protein
VGIMSDDTESNLPASHSKFWDDLAEDLKDPEFRAEYTRQSRNINAADQAKTYDTINEFLDALDD